MRETSRDYAHPFRPRGVRLANAGLGLAQRMTGGPPPLTATALMDAALRKAGVERFVDEQFVEPLERLVASIDAEAALTPLGRTIVRGRLTGILVNRLRAEALWRAHPEMLDAETPAPIVIVGLPRTGTTLLHRLLGADPRHRALASWEALSPIPAQDLDPRDTARRVRNAERAERGLAYMAPDFFAVHPVEAQAPEEEVVLLDHTLLSSVAEATMNVPSFAAWLEAQDQTPAYRYLKRLLQTLQWQGPTGRWVLKTPHHLEWLDTLLDVFPDARIVHTHRDPLETLPSLCSLIAHGRGVFSDNVDPHEVGAQWLRKTQRMLARAQDTRARVGETAFIDVHYAELVADPVAQLERIYAFIGTPVTAASRAAVEATRAAGGQFKHGRHVYAAEDFGFTAEQVRDAYA